MQAPTLNDRDKVRHLLRRFGFGASRAEVDDYAKAGYAAAVNRLVNYEDQPQIEWNDQVLAGANGFINMPSQQVLYNHYVLTTQRPLEEALTMFWHDHFATSAEKVMNPDVMRDHIKMLRRHASGSFYDLLLAVSTDPAMLYWLDNFENKKGRPNENFAREVMELFTLGEGNYSEDDVLDASRAFTGWTLARTDDKGRVRIQTGVSRGVQFHFHKQWHDAGRKTVLGRTGNLDGEDVIDLLVKHPRTAAYICKKLWEWFVYNDPEPEIIERLARTFRTSNYRIKPVMKAMASMPQFFSAKAQRGVVKNPAYFCASTARAIGAHTIAAQKAASGKPNTGVQSYGIAFEMRRSASNMGMKLMEPPDVDGWISGTRWISSATMVERIKWADQLFGRARNQVLLRDVAWDLFKKRPDISTAVGELLVAFDAEALRPKAEQLVRAAHAAAGGTRVTKRNSREVARQVTRLIFGSPEFQFA